LGIDGAKGLWGFRGKGWWSFSPGGEGPKRVKCFPHLGGVTPLGGAPPKEVGDFGVPPLGGSGGKKFSKRPRYFVLPSRGGGSHIGEEVFFTPRLRGDSSK